MFLSAFRQALLLIPLLITNQSNQIPMAAA